MMVTGSSRRSLHDREVFSQKRPPTKGFSVDKRIAKRHKRQVARAKKNVKMSEPDLRTPEQVRADREASGGVTGRGGGGGVNDAKPSGHSHVGPAIVSTPKAP